VFLHLLNTKMGLTVLSIQSPAQIRFFGKIFPHQSKV
jgi:hypothetical protein